MKKKLLAKSAVTLAVTNALFLSKIATAQEAEKEIEKIEVTATKRVMSIQDVPIAVTSIGGDDLVEQQITDILSIEKAIPGVTVASFGNNPQVIMRGAGSAGTTESAVPIYHNNMYIPTSGQALAGYMDVERIEALRGPQGTLFGRNTYGGLINVITKKPDAEEFEFGAAVTVGNYGLLKAEGFVNVPLTDSVAIRLTGADEKRDGYVENVNNPEGDLKDSDYTYIRGQLLFTPMDNLSINLTASHWKDTGNGSLNWAYKAAGIPLDKNDPTKINAKDGYLDPRMGVYTGCEGEPDRAGGRSVAGNVCDGDASASILADPRKVDYDFTPIRELEETSFYLNVDWEVAEHSVVLNAAMFDYQAVNLMDAEFSSMASWVDGTYGTTKSKQADLTISSMFDGPLQYTVGAYFFDSQDPDNKSAYLFGSLTESWYAYSGATPETPSWAYWNSEGRGGTKSSAIYGQATYALSEKLNLTAGLRSTTDNRESQGSKSLSGTLGWGNWSEYLGPELPTFDYTDQEVQYGEDSHVDYRLGADYKLSNDLMVYGSFSTAYIAGATDVVTQKLLDPQTNESLEIGFKSTLLDGKLRLNGSAYSAKYEGLMTTSFVEQGDTGVAVAVSTPGGSINSRGAEVEGFYYATDELTIDFGLSLDMSEYDEFIVGAGNLVWNNEAPIGSETINGEYVYVMDGKDTPYTPDMTLSVGVSYDMDLGEYGYLKPYVHTYYNSGYMTNRAPVFFGEQDSYVKFDLSVNWESVDGDFTVRAYVNNATDELIQTYTEILSRARVAYDYSAPRNMGIRFGYNF